ncbi:MAG: efflux RND transporter periplasmic adaptor subunit [Armatimonadota bacterium]|nr:efflux RND transporter periplasmic adaptor subunit [bacterium]
MKVKIIALLLVVALASAGITYSLVKKSPVSAEHVEEEHTSEPIKIAGLQVAPAISGDGWNAIEVTGKVAVPPDRLVKISPRIDGKIVAAHGTVGDYVHRGQELAVISSVELAEARADYRQALGRLNTARKNYDREVQIVKLGAVSARPLEEARTESFVSQGDLSDAKSGLAQAKSELIKEESELVQCKARLDRAKELYVEKIISRHDMESAEAEYKRDTASVDTAKSKVAQAESNVDKAKSKLDISKQYLSREEKVYKSKALDAKTLQSARADIDAAQVDVQSAADRIRVLGADPSGSGDTLSVRSPISGRIVSRQSNIGEMATSSDAIFTVADLSRVWIEADVYEKDLSQVRKGQPSEIRVDAYPDKVFTGKIDSIGDILSPESRTAKVRIVVANPDGLLRGEMFAKVSLLTERNGRSVLIAKDAILDDAGEKIAFTPCMECPEDKKAGTNACGAYDKLHVTTGHVRGRNIEVLNGIEPGTLVVTTGAYQLKTALGSGKLEAGCTDH